MIPIAGVTRSRTDNFRNRTYMQILEAIATISGLIHVYLLTKEKVIAWPFGILSVAVYVYIFFVAKLYSDALLHIVYCGLNVYGWIRWSRRSGNDLELAVSRLSKAGIAIAALLIIAGSIAWGTLMDTQTDADFPYFDAYTTVASLCAQYLLAKKKIDNWIIWILVDVVAMPIYFAKGLYLTSALYFVYLLLCISGFLQWRKSLSVAVSH